MNHAALYEMQCTHTITSREALKAEVARMTADCVRRNLSPQTLGYGKVAKRFFASQKLIVPIDNCFRRLEGTGPIDGWAVLCELRALGFDIGKPRMVISVKKRRHLFDGGCHAEITFRQIKRPWPPHPFRIRRNRIR